MEKRLISIIVICIISIGIVGASAYYFGHAVGQETGLDEGYEQGFADAEKMMEQAQTEIISKTTEGAEIDPLENLPSANPMENVNTNPFEDGYENPFE
jgi:uncharacterized protein YpmB